MRFVYFFIDRPVFAGVLSIVTILAGVLSILGLPIAQYPEIAPPTVVVSASYPGANAQTVADTVAAPIEEQINGVERMLYMTSQSTNDGSLRINITFEVGTNLDVAQVQVQNRVSAALPVLPQEVQQRGVTVKKSSPDITLVVTLVSPDNSKDTLYLSNFATLRVKDQLSRLEGVGDINVFGARDYAMRLWLDPFKIAARNMTAGDVTRAIREQNVQVAAGIIGGPPIKDDSVQFQYTMNAQGRLTAPEDFENIIVKVDPDGKTTRLKDIGRVELGAADYARANTLDGKPGVGLGIYQLPGTNSIDTANAIYARMKELKKEFPPGVDYVIPYDTTIFVRDSIKDVIKTLLEGIALVVIVVLVFLQNWRAALVPLLAIPVSLIGTFAIMWLAGFSMNNLSLFGLVLAIGIVVDDAIVVVENVERWINEGYSPREATFKAMKEVTPAVIAIAFGLSAVFIPVAFVSGITGQFYRQFALTVSFSTLLSAFNSLTLSPALASLLLKPHGESKDKLDMFITRIFGGFFGWFNRCFDKVTGKYVLILRKVVRASTVSIAVYVALIGVTYLGFKSVPTGFIPTQDQGYLFLNVQLPDAASINRTQRVMDNLSMLAKQVPGVKHVFAVSGVSVVNFSSSSAAGFAFVTLEPFSQRSKDSNQSLDAISKNLKAKFATVNDALALVIPPPPVRGIGSAGGFKVQIQDKSGQGSPQDLQRALDMVVAEAKTRPEMTGVFSSYRASLPQIYADIDRIKAKRQNVQVTDVFEALQVYLGGLYINDFNFLGRVWRVLAQADGEFRATSDQVAQFQVRNQSGEMVPLGAVLNLLDVTGPDRIQRFNLYKAAEINGTTAKGYSSGEAIAALEEVAKEVLPNGYGFEWTEFAFQEKLAGNTALLIFPLCVLFVWLTHAAEYESFLLSTIIILIVPMCLLCGIGGVWAQGMDNNIFTQIGFVVLAGMSVKNAVLIVEFAKQKQEHEPGLSAGEAVIDAARLRLRPILMTSFAFIFGVLPLLTAKGAGAEMRHALGTVVFWGMLGVTIFGVFLTPVFYEVIRRRWPAKHGVANAAEIDQ